MKKVVSVILSLTLAAVLFTGCSNNKDVKYSDSVLIIGYTENEAPFIEAKDDGTAEGFIPELFEKAVFEATKGDFKTYRFEKVEKGYALEEDGGFSDEGGKEYSASLLVGATHKNDGTFNEDYSFTEPLITNRVVAITKKDGKIKSFKDFTGAKVLTASETAKAAFEKHSAVYSLCKSVKEQEIAPALASLDDGRADAVIVDEFTLMPTGKAENYTVLEGELDTVEYVIACAKYSGWKDSINEAIFEYKSPEYNKHGDEFTPLVEKYFGYNASSFGFEPSGDK